MAIFPASAPRPDARIVAAIVAIITVAMFGLLAPAHAGSLDNWQAERQYWIKEDGRWKIVFEGAA